MEIGSGLGLGLKIPPQHDTVSPATAFLASQATESVALVITPGRVRVRARVRVRVRARVRFRVCDWRVCKGLSRQTISIDNG